MRTFVVLILVTLGAFQERVYAACTSPAGSAGQIIFESPNFKLCDGTNWFLVGTGGSFGDFKADGSVSMTGNLRLNGNWLSNDGGNEGVFVATNGNVGVGTSTPGYALEVPGQVSIGQMSNVGIGVAPSGTGASGTTFKLSIGSGGFPTSLDVANTNTGANTYGAYISRTGAATTGYGLYVNSTNATNNYSAAFMGGNVGIGTASPAERLDVSGGVKIGNSSGTNAGTLRWNGTNFQGYNGTAWQNLIVDLPASGGCDSTQTYNTPGTHAYTVPASYATITVRVWGAGGGGGFYFGTYSTSGGSSTVSSLGLSAGGGGPGQTNGGGGLGGTASGGTTNLSGGNGTNGTAGVISGTGGTAPNGGGGGGPGVTSGPGQNGATPGGGGGGGSPGGGNTPSGGGSGAYTEKVFTPGTLPFGTTINDIVVGAGGIGHDLAHPNRGGKGGDGQVSIICSTTGSPPANNRGILFLDTGAYSSDSNFVYSTNNRLGLGTSSPGYKLDVVGDVNIGAANALRFGGTSVCTSVGCTASSDLLLKENIQPLRNSLDKILSLQGVEYDYIDKAQFTDQHQIGVIAQEVESVYPEVVVTDPKTGLKSVAYGQLVAPLIESIKALHAQIVSLQKENANLKNEKQQRDQKIESLENRLNSVERAIQNQSSDVRQ